MPPAASPIDYAFLPAPISTLPIEDSGQLFPIHRIYCVGRNYSAHIVEMGGDPDREKPFFFQKSPDCIVPPGNDFPYPAATKDVHHEIELVVALGEGGTNINEANALDKVFGYAAGIDMTRRDLQAEAKKSSRPWEVAKSFENSAPCSAIRPIAGTGHPAQGRIWLSVNGEPRQEGDLGQMIWKTAEIIAHLSRLFTLLPGDLIMSGTPAGVGPVHRGDHVQGGVDGVGILELTVT